MATVLRKGSYEGTVTQSIKSHLKTRTTVDKILILPHNDALLGSVSIRSHIHMHIQLIHLIINSVYDTHQRQQISRCNTEKESTMQKSTLPHQVNITAGYLITPTSARQLIKSNSQSLEQH